MNYADYLIKSIEDLYLNPENDTDETLLCFFKGESK
jgi:hypothetical protein